MYRNTYVQINIDNLKNNVEQIVNHYKNYQYYIGVVKGNAYGHDDFIVNDLIDSGINYLAASTLEEVISIRKKNNNIPILCLEPIDINYIDVCIKNNITITVHDYEYFKELLDTEINHDLKVHLKIDSGMNRLGLKDEDEIKDTYEKLSNHPNIILEGIYTHFMTPGISDKIWDNQVSRFKKLTRKIDLKQIPIVHMGKSLTLINHPKIDICNAIRLGIIMYGFDQTPKPQTGIKAKLRALKAKMRIKKYKISPTNLNCPINLKPAFSLYSEIMQVKKVEQSEYIGYGTYYKATEKMKVGIVPIGYGDGFNRRNSGREVLINKKRFPIIGEVGMGMIIVKIDDSVKVHDKVMLIGEDISVREVSRHIKTTVYETMCMIGKSVPRVFVKNNKVIHIEEYK